MYMRFLAVTALLNIAWSTQGQSVPLSLEQALKTAKENNKELQVKRQNIRVAETERLSARLFSPFNPALELEGVSDFLTAKSGEGALQLSLTQELELGGQRGYRKDIAEAHVGLAESEVTAAERTVVRETRLAFGTLLYAQEQISFLQVIEDLTKAIRDVGEKRRNEGFIPASEYTFLNLDYTRAKVARLKAETALNDARIQLANLLGMASADSVEVSGDLSFQSLSLPEDSLLSLSVANRTELQQVRLIQKTVRLERGLAFRERIPNLNLSAFYSREKTVFAAENFVGAPQGIQGLRDVDHLFGVRLSFTLPVIDRRRAQISRAVAEADVAGTSEQRILQQIRLEVSNAYRNLKRAEQAFEITKQTLPAADSVFQLLRTAYSEGRVAVDAYLTQKDRLLQARSDYLEAYAAYSQARAQLEEAVSLSWENIR